LESVTKGVFGEKSYKKIDEIIDVSSMDEMKELINRLHKGEALNDEGGKHARSHSQEGEK
jgi:hypothetical protein